MLFSKFDKVAIVFLAIVFLILAVSALNFDPAKPYHALSQVSVNGDVNCSFGKVVVVDSTGTLTCKDVNFSGSASLPTCSDGDVLKYNAISHDWYCGNDLGVGGTSNVFKTFKVTGLTCGNPATGNGTRCQPFDGYNWGATQLFMDLYGYTPAQVTDMFDAWNCPTGSGTGFADPIGLEGRSPTSCSCDHGNASCEPTIYDYDLPPRSGYYVYYNPLKGASDSFCRKLCVTPSILQRYGTVDGNYYDGILIDQNEAAGTITCTCMGTTGSGTVIGSGDGCSLTKTGLVNVPTTLCNGGYCAIAEGSRPQLTQYNKVCQLLGNDAYYGDMISGNDTGGSVNSKMWWGSSWETFVGSQYIKQISCLKEVCDGSTGTGTGSSAPDYDSGWFCAQSFPANVATTHLYELNHGLGTTPVSVKILQSLDTTGCTPYPNPSAVPTIVSASAPSSWSDNLSQNTYTHTDGPSWWQDSTKIYIMPGSGEERTTNVGNAISYTAFNTWAEGPPITTIEYMKARYGKYRVLAWKNFSSASGSGTTLPTCSVGQFLQQTASGWECVDTTMNDEINYLPITNVTLTKVGTGVTCNTLDINLIRDNNESTYIECSFPNDFQANHYADLNFNFPEEIYAFGFVDYYIKYNGNGICVSGDCAQVSISASQIGDASSHTTTAKNGTLSDTYKGTNFNIHMNGDKGAYSTAPGVIRIKEVEFYTFR